MIEQGFERDRLDGRSNGIRWWLYLESEGGRARNQLARKGVIDREFRFARGGRCTTDEEARALLATAYREARVELASWRCQPSHKLGAAGQLIPLDEVDPRALGSGS